MNKGKITISSLGVVFEPNSDGKVWLSRWELAALFGVFTGKITANIKAVIRSGAVKPPFEGSLMQVGNTILPELFDMEMIIALAFRIDSANADKLRKWVLRKAVVDTTSLRPNIFIRCSGSESAN